MNHAGLVLLGALCFCAAGCSSGPRNVDEEPPAGTPAPTPDPLPPQPVPSVDLRRCSAAYDAALAAWAPVDEAQDADLARFRIAADSLALAVAVCPEGDLQTESYFRLGMALLYVGEFDDAADAIETYLTVEPASEEASVRAARLALRMEIVIARTCGDSSQRDVYRRGHLALLRENNDMAYVLFRAASSSDCGALQQAAREYMKLTQDRIREHLP